MGNSLCEGDKTTNKYDVEFIKEVNIIQNKAYLID